MVNVYGTASSGEKVYLVGIVTIIKTATVFTAYSAGDQSQGLPHAMQDSAPDIPRGINMPTNTPALCGALMRLVLSFTSLNP